MPRLRVLLAEDHDGVADQLRRLLEIECDVVAVVGDGESLVSAVDVLSPEVIVSDVTMPLLHGLAAAQVILARHRDACIVFVTVNDDPRVARKALLLGAFGYVLKTDAGEELLTAVHAARARQPHLSTNLRSRLL